MIRPIRTLVVDDEPLAREGLRVSLAGSEDVEIIGEAVDGVAAVEAIRSQRPDLVLLDVQMPGLNGFDVLEEVSGCHLPVVIFVTAYDQYAIKAFEVHALDYLLKPFPPERLRQALDHARRALASDDERETDDRLARLLSSRAAAAAAALARPYLTRLPVKARDRFLLLKMEEVSWIDAAQNYVQLHARGGTFLVRGTMSDIEARLDPAQFARIHRSTIVNLDRVREIAPTWQGDFDVLLHDGTTLKLSRSYRDRVLGLSSALPPGRGESVQE
jgi:two-component system LytT family response regulator